MLIIWDSFKRNASGGGQNKGEDEKINKYSHKEKDGFLIGLDKNGLALSVNVSNLAMTLNAD